MLLCYAFVLLCSHSNRALFYDYVLELLIRAMASVVPDLTADSYGGGEGVHWHYTAATKSYVKEWAADYDGWWNDNGVWRPVRWECNAVVPIEKDGKRYFKELWEWLYMD